MASQISKEAENSAKEHYLILFTLNTVLKGNHNISLNQGFAVTFFRIIEPSFD